MWGTFNFFTKLLLSKNMEYIALIGTVTLIHLLAVISPGPDFIVAVKNSLSYSRKTGIWTAVGFGLGISVHLLYCVAGLAILISQSILLFTVIKFLGAGYLIYIGWKSFFSKASSIENIEVQVHTDISPFAAIKSGFLTNVLNPKATLFFLSLFTLVIGPTTPPAIVATMSLIMVLNTILWFSFVALLMTQKRMRSAFSRFQGIFNKVFGGLLIAIGLKIAFSEK